MRLNVLIFWKFSALKRSCFNFIFVFYEKFLPLNTITVFQYYPSEV